MKLRLGRNVWNTVGMLLLAIAVFFSLRYWPQRLMPAEPDATASKEPDYGIENFHAVDLDETGHLRYELTATHLVHYAAPERAELSDPEMVFYRNATPDDPDAEQGPVEPWQLTAARGRIAQGGERVDLEGNVKVTRSAHDDGEGVDAVRMTMETSHMTVFGKQEVATTDAAVHLTADRSVLDGVGMQVDLKKGQMHLLSQVKGEYVPR